MPKENKKQLFTDEQLVDKLVEEVRREYNSRGCLPLFIMIFLCIAGGVTLIITNHKKGKENKEYNINKPLMEPTKVIEWQATR